MQEFQTVVSGLPLWYHISYIAFPTILCQNAYSMFSGFWILSFLIIILFIVELYKCEVMATRCGECLNPTNSRYGCGWCQALSSKCDVQQLCPDTAPFLQASVSSCPDLEITDVCIFSTQPLHTLFLLSPYNSFMVGAHS